MTVQSTLRGLVAVSGAASLVAAAFRLRHDRKVAPEKKPTTPAGTASGATSIKLVPSYDSRVLRFYPSQKLPSSENVILRGGYLTSISYRNKIPNWVAEKITIEGLDGKNTRSEFASDSDVPSKWRSENSDYFDSGYSRGHLAAAANHKDSESNMMQTFLLSGNILPQDFSNNSCDWYRLENLSKRFGKSCEDVYVVSGPLWLPKDVTQEELRNFAGLTVPKKEKLKTRTISYESIGNGVAVPTHLWKVIVAAKPKVEFVKNAWPKEKSDYPQYVEPGALANMNLVGIASFIMPNGPENEYKPLTDFKVPLDAVETMAGVDLEGLVRYCKQGVVEEVPEVEQKLCNCLKAFLPISGKNKIPAAKDPQPCDTMTAAIQRRSFLSSIDLCGSDGKRCADEHVKTDKRLMSSRYLGRVMSAKRVEGLDALWKEIERHGLHTDSFLKRQFDIHREKLVKLDDANKSTTEGKKQPQPTLKPAQQTESPKTKTTPSPTPDARKAAAAS